MTPTPSLFSLSTADPGAIALAREAQFERDIAAVLELAELFERRPALRFVRVLIVPNPGGPAPALSPILMSNLGPCSGFLEALAARARSFREGMELFEIALLRDASPGPDGSAALGELERWRDRNAPALLSLHPLSLDRPRGPEPIAEAFVLGAFGKARFARWQARLISQAAPLAAPAPTIRRPSL